jgi:hypothetical protein
MSTSAAFSGLPTLESVTGTIGTTAVANDASCGRLKSRSYAQVRLQTKFDTYTVGCKERVYSTSTSKVRFQLICVK